jgi:hypothetical protein
LFILAIAVIGFTSILAIPRYTLPGTPVPVPLPTHLSFISYPEAGNELPGVDQTQSLTETLPGVVQTVNLTETEVAILAYPLGANGMPGDEATLLFSQPYSHDCQPYSLHPSPASQFLIIQFNCEAHLTLQLLNLENGENPPQQADSHFLNWSPDGEWFIYRKPDAEAIYLASAISDEEQLLDLPFGTYDVVFAPDGQTVVYAASSGLDLGSEIGSLNLTSGEVTIWQQFPEQIITYPRWSPDGQYLAYILMPDSNIPFMAGELWLADGSGQPLTLLDEVDTGHGYPPVWSSDSTTISYIVRENTETIAANHDVTALHSNIYQVDVSSGEVSQLTDFTESRVYDISWTPEGDQLAFTADEAVWLLSPGETPFQISPPGDMQHPVWLSLSMP